MDQSWTEHDDVFLLVTSGQSPELALDKANRLLWSAGDLADLKAYIDGYSLLGNGKVDRARTLFNVLVDSGNEYIRYYSSIFLEVCRARELEIGEARPGLSESATRVLIEFADAYVGNARVSSYHAVNWILLATRLNVALAFAQLPRIDFLALRSQVLWAIRTIGDGSNLDLKRDDVALFLIMVSHSSDTEIAGAAVQASDAWDVDLTIGQGVFP